MNVCLTFMALKNECGFSFLPLENTMMFVMHSIFSSAFYDGIMTP